MEKLNGWFYVVYRDSENPKRCMLSIKFPSIKSPNFLKIRGKRAVALHKLIVLTLDNLRVPYSIEKDASCEILRVPWATGLAITTFLLAVYSRPKPLIYAQLLDKMLTGSMPLATYLTSMTEMAIHLSEYLGNSNGDPLISHKCAIVVSRMMITLLDALNI